MKRLHCVCVQVDDDAFFKEGGFNKKGFNIILYKIRPTKKVKMPTTKKVVLNSSYGGFSLSKTVMHRYRKANGILTVDDERWFFTHSVKRDDPVLIQIIEDVGLKNAGGGLMKLSIVEIPDDVNDWEILDEDGAEWVAETHRIFNNAPCDEMPRKVVINVKYGGFSLSNLVKQQYLARKNLHLDRYVQRDDPELIEIIESVGLDRAAGDHAQFAIVGVPTDVEWEIAEYDGNETVVEKHREWC